MTAQIPRLRMFAGPNGSGKSTIKDGLPAPWLGVYVNADDMEKTIRATGKLHWNAFGISPPVAHVQDFLRASTLLAKAGLLAQVDKLCLTPEGVQFGDVPVNSYWASVLADLIRHMLLAARISLSFETVMSSPDKIDFLKTAKAAGYRIYLYFVATEHPDINVARVQHRVQTGGHPVDEDKVRARYVRTLGLLSEAVFYTDRAYIFDNSDRERIWVAEVTDGAQLEIKTDAMPAWFKAALWDSFDDGAAGL